MILFLIYIVLSCGILTLFNIPRKLNLQVGSTLGVFIFKIMISVAMIQYYSNGKYERDEIDIFKFYDDGQLLNDVFYKDPTAYLQLLSGIYQPSIELDDYMKYSINWRKQPDVFLKKHQLIDFNWFNDQRLITKINSVLHFFSQQNIYIHALFFCFISMISSALMVQFTQSIFQSHSPLTTWYFAFLPGILVWTILPLKESILFLGVALMLLSFSRLLHQLQTKYLVSLVFGVILVLLSKYYVLLILSPLTIYLFFKEKTPDLSWIPNFITITAALLTMYYLLPQFEVKMNDNLRISNLYPEATVLEEYSPYPTSFIDYLKTLPNGIYRVLNEPNFANYSGSFQQLAAIENIGILILLLLSVLNLVKHKRWSLILMILSTLIVAGTLIGMTTLIVGNLVRYKMTLLIVFGTIISSTITLKPFFKKQ